MEFPQKVMVTDQEIDLSSLTKSQKKYFVDLAEHIKQQYLASDTNRYVVSVSGPSGSGKSVLCAILKSLLKDEIDFAIYWIDLDAFHFSNEELKERSLMEVKGRYDTYDIKTLYELLKIYKENKEIRFPFYSREDHKPHSDGPIIHPGKAIILMAGLWFQRNDNNWKKVRECIDYTFSIEGPRDKFRQNTIDRHMRGGRTKDNAEQFYDKSDLKNTQEISENSFPSAEILPYFENIEN